MAAYQSAEKSIPKSSRIDNKGVPQRSLPNPRPPVQQPQAQLRPALQQLLDSLRTLGKTKPCRLPDRTLRKMPWRTSRPSDARERNKVLGSRQPEFLDEWDERE